MKINIFMGPWFPVPTVQGGSHHRLWQGLAEQFAQRGHQVTILCRSYPGQPQRETIAGVEYVRQSGFAQSASTFANLAKDFFYGLRMLPLVPSADITVVNDFWFPILASVFRRKVGRVVISVGRFPKKQMFLYREADRFAAVSQAVGQGIKEQTPEFADRVRVFPNPVDTSAFRPSADSHQASAERLILYVGRIHPEKGIHVLLDAFAILSQRFTDLKLKVLGPVNLNQGGAGDGYLRELKEKAAGLNVEFALPTFRVAELAEAYRNADVFCYPSLAEHGEALPIAPLEAMACGVVTVVSNLACFKDYIEEGETGITFNHRVGDGAKNLADKLADVLSNEEASHRIGANASLRAQEFSYEKVAARYLEDFEELLTPPAEQEAAAYAGNSIHFVG